MGSTNNTYRVLTLTAGAAGNLDSPVGLNVKSTVEYVSSNPAGMISYTLGINGYKCSATCKARTPFSPASAGGAATTVSATLQELASGSQATVSVTNMRAGDYELDQQHGELGTYQQTFEYDNSGTDDVNNITASA
jgi:hypothetical protein